MSAGRTITREELNDVSQLIPHLTDIVYQYIGNPFIIKLKISDSHEITIPAIVTESGLIIDWGDNICEEIFEKDNIKHLYNSSGTYYFSIFCDIAKVSFINVAELIEISQWEI